MRIILGAALFLAACVLPPEQPASAQQQSAQEQVGSAANSVGGHLSGGNTLNRVTAAESGTKARNPIKAREYQPPCAEPKNHNRCELEAEWKSAEAAREAAKWAKWQTIFSGAGILGLLISLWFSGLATRAATRASVDAQNSLAISERGANAASDQVEIAKSSSERQLRAYVGVSTIQTNPAGDEHFASKIVFKNYGQTPAYNCVVYAAASIENWPAIDPSESEIEPTAQTRHVTLHPTAEIEGYAACDASGNFPAIESSAAAIYVFGRIEYEDAEKIARVTNFAYRGTGGVFFRTRELHLCLGGNTAT